MAKKKSNEHSERAREARELVEKLKDDPRAAVVVALFVQEMVRRSAPNPRRSAPRASSSTEPMR